MKKIYNLEISKRNNREEPFKKEVLSFDSKQEAQEKLKIEFDSYIKERGLDLTDTKNDGICSFNEEFGCLVCDWVGGDVFV